jgi:hypothetical protein
MRNTVFLNYWLLGSEGGTWTEDGSAIAQVVSIRLLTAEARFLSQVSPCEIYGGQSDTRSGSSLMYHHRWGGGRSSTET